MEHVKEQRDPCIKMEASVSSSSESESSCGPGIHKPISLQRSMTGPTRRSSKGGWTEQEDKVLIAAVETFNGKNWKKIAECVPGRTDVQCLHRWQKVLNPYLNKGPWTKQEDDLIGELVMKKGKRNWSEIAKFLPGRIGKQCRERWHNHLNPDIKRTAWTKEEELTLIEAHQIYGNRWAEIAKFLHGRSENSIKNHWNCSVKKKIKFNASLSSHPDIFNFNTEGKMADVKQSSEEKVNVCSKVEANLGCGTMYAGQNQVQHLDTENETDFCTKPKSIASLNQTNNGSWEVMGFEANDTRESIEAARSVDDMSLGSLCYRPLQLKDLDILLETGRFPSTDSHIQNTSIPNSLYNNTPPSYNEGIFADCTSPEHILRNAARNFKNTPSIIRKERFRFPKKDASSPRRLEFPPCKRINVSDPVQ